MCAAAGFVRFYLDAMLVEAEGVFKWTSTNDALSYTNWAPREPNNIGGNEHCVEIISEDGLWNDISCSNIYTIVCQIPGAYLLQHAVVSAKVAESCFDVCRMVR